MRQAGQGVVLFLWQGAALSLQPIAAPHPRRNVSFRACVPSYLKYGVTIHAKRRQICFQMSVGGGSVSLNCTPLLQLFLLAAPVREAVFLAPVLSA